MASCAESDAHEVRRTEAILPTFSAAPLTKSSISGWICVRNRLEPFAGRIIALVRPAAMLISPQPCFLVVDTPTMTEGAILSWRTRSKRFRWWRNRLYQPHNAA
jgi:hypothetical protein